MDELTHKHRPYALTQHFLSSLSRPFNCRQNKIKAMHFIQIVVFSTTILIATSIIFGGKLLSQESNEQVVGMAIGDITYKCTRMNQNSGANSVRSCLRKFSLEEGDTPKSLRSRNLSLSEAHLFCEVGAGQGINYHPCIDYLIRGNQNLYR